MRILIATTYVPFAPAEDVTLVRALTRELTSRGFNADATFLPFDEDPSEAPRQTLALRLLDLSECNGEPIDRLVTVREPSLALRHPDKVAWLIRPPERNARWDAGWDGPEPDDPPAPDGDAGTPDGDAGRADGDAGGDGGDGPRGRPGNRYLRECRKIYAGSRAIADRLADVCGVTAAGVLRPPPDDDGPRRPGPFGDDFLCAGRPGRDRRQSLAIRALARTSRDARLVIPEGGDDPSFRRELEILARAEGVADRVRFAPGADEAERAELAAGCCGALDLSPAGRSDGRATLEAFLARKPVVTLTDCGDAAELVRDGHSGFTVDPDPEALAGAMGRLWGDRDGARRMGETGFASLAERGVDWDRVVEELTS